MKREPERDYSGTIVGYKYMGYDFLTLYEAEQLRAFHYKNQIRDEYYPIIKWLWPIGMPRFVDVYTSLKTGILTYYKHNDISMALPQIDDDDF